jgi:hypothetical protein
MNVFTLGVENACPRYIDKLKHVVAIENNFEQVIAMAKTKELEKLCIYMDVWNICNRCNQMRGQGAAEKIHEIDPTIPILIWDGREYEPEFAWAPPAFQVSGKILPIKNPNELYLSFDHYSNIIKITVKFFRGELTKEDVKIRECLQFDLKG